MTRTFKKHPTKVKLCKSNIWVRMIGIDHDYKICKYKVPTYVLQQQFQFNHHTLLFFGSLYVIGSTVEKRR